MSGKQDQVLTSLGQQFQQLLHISPSKSAAGQDAATAAPQGEDDAADAPAGGAGAAALPSEKELNGSKVADLKSLLQERGLSTSGRKADLVARLLACSPSGVKGAAAPATVCVKAALGKGNKLMDPRGSVSDVAQSGGGGDDRQEAASALILAWQACHPAGPPLLIRRCGRALGRCLGATHPQASIFKGHLHSEF